MPDRGPYAVPGWSPVDPAYDHTSMCRTSVTGGSCYAEQYERFYRDPTHPTSRFHAAAFGPDAEYQATFFPAFKPVMYNATAWAELFREAGAGYVRIVVLWAAPCAIPTVLACALPTVLA